MIYQYPSTRDLDGTHNRMINRHFGWVRALKYPIKPGQSSPKAVDHMIKKSARIRAEVGLSFEGFYSGRGRLIYIMGGEIPEPLGKSHMGQPTPPHAA
jgi:hypothetical protein